MKFTVSVDHFSDPFCGRPGDCIFCMSPAFDAYLLYYRLEELICPGGAYERGDERKGMTAHRLPPISCFASRTSPALSPKSISTAVTLSFNTWGVSKIHDSYAHICEWCLSGDPPSHHYLISLFWLCWTRQSAREEKS